MIGISLLTLAPGRMGGSETYVRALTAALAENGSLDYLVAAPPDALDAAGGLPSVAGGSSGAAGRARCLVAAARSTALNSAEAVHHPLTIPLPQARVPRVITLHDVLHRDLPSLVPRAVRSFRAVAYDRAARRSQLVIVPSRFVQERAHARIGLDSRKVRVIPHGVDHTLFRPGAEVREPFLLYPARFWPHKNHERLFDAFARVRRRRPELELVLTGGGHGGRSLPAGVSSRGLVSDEELARLYRTASVTVFPSLYEGFGTPVIEAMASGCAVAASSTGALPEVAGEAAVLFDPLSVESIEGGITRALAEHEELRSRGFEHAARFTWEAAATAHESVYRELLALPTASSR